MIGLLSTVLENAAKELSLQSLVSAGKEMLVWREKRHVSNIGVSMFNLYLAAEEIVENGFDLIPRLEFMARKHREQVLVNGYIAPTLEAQAQEVKEKIRAQIERIYAFAELQTVLQSSVAAVDRDAGRRLYSLSVGKASLLRFLTGSRNATDVANGAYIALDLPAIEEAIRQELANFSKGGMDLLPRREPVSPSQTYTNRTALVVVDLPWSQTTYEAIELYLNGGLARRRLEALHGTAVAFRHSIEEHFAIHDILIALERRRVPPPAADRPQHPPP